MEVQEKEESGKSKRGVQDLALEFIETRSESAFNALYKRLKPGMVYHATNILKDAAAAEDVVSEAFAKMWKKIDQYNPYWNFSTWAYKIVYNESMQFLRKAKTVSMDTSYTNYSDIAQHNQFMLLDKGVDKEGSLEQPNWFFDEVEDTKVALFDMVMKEINNLPQLYKDIMIDREINKMKYQDISDKYGIEINTVKTRINRARTKICKIANMGTRNKNKKDKDVKTEGEI
jgi:RNA polymerase sigma factor (sigma-70 family)